MRAFVGGWYGVVLALVLSPSLLGQESAGIPPLPPVIQKALDAYYDPMAGVKDYSVDLKITTGDAAPQEGTYVWKAPDKVKVMSRGAQESDLVSAGEEPAAIRGFRVILNMFRAGKCAETMDGEQTLVECTAPGNGVASVRLWMDAAGHFTRLRIVTSPEPGATSSEEVEMAFESKDEDGKRLLCRAKMTRQGSAEQMSWEYGTVGERMLVMKRIEEAHGSKNVVEYSNYKLDQGVPDSAFEEDDQEK